MNKFNTPVLFLIYNRTDTTDQVFRRIKELQPTSLYIVADGPKEDNSEDFIKCENTRRIVEPIDWACSVKKLFRTKNEGTNTGVPNAISWFFNQVDYGIIVEDDCLPSLSFFYYCNELLEKYKNKNEVFFISGNCRLPENFTKNYSESYEFLRTSGIWGWATWKRAWENYLPELKIQDADEKYIHSYFPNPKESKMWLKNFRFEMWDYRWHYSVFRKKGLVIAPRINLVKNIGFGEGATHTNSSAHPFSRFEAHSLPIPLKHPESIALNEEWDRNRFETLQTILSNQHGVEGFLPYLKKAVKWFL